MVHVSAEGGAGEEQAASLALPWASLCSLPPLAWKKG